MIPWALLDTAEMPDGGGDLRLMQRGAEFSIMCGAIELMNSRLSGSEEALAAWRRQGSRTARGLTC
jgi:spermidine synthase